MKKISLLFLILLASNLFALSSVLTEIGSHNSKTLEAWTHCPIKAVHQSFVLKYQVKGSEDYNYLKLCYAKDLNQANFNLSDLNICIKQPKTKDRFHNFIIDVNSEDYGTEGRYFFYALAYNKDNNPLETKTEKDINIIVVDLHPPQINYFEKLDNTYLYEKTIETKFSDNHYLPYGKFIIDMGALAITFSNSNIKYTPQGQAKNGEAVFEAYLENHHIGQYEINNLFNKDTNYSVSLEIYDCAGNTTTSQKTWFILLDKTFSFILNDNNAYANNSNFKIEWMGKEPEKIAFSCDGSNYLPDVNYTNSLFYTGDLNCPEGDLNFYIKATYADNNQETEYKNIYLDKTSPFFADKNIKLSRKDKNTIQIEWNQATDNVEIDKYLVFRNDQKIGQTNKDTFIYLDYLQNAEGTQEYFIKAVDKAGNTTDSDKNQIYFDNKAPEIENYAPEENQKYLNNPLVKIKIKEENLNLDKNKTYLEIDGNKVNYDLNNNIITYQTTYAKGNHIIKAVLEDTYENKTEKEWSFSKEERDLAIKDLSATQTTAKIIAKNQGSINETAEIKLYVNNNLANTWDINIDSNSEKEINYSWYLRQGTYAIKAEIYPFTDDIETANNSKEIQITIKSSGGGGGGGGGGSGGGSNTPKPKEKEEEIDKPKEEPKQQIEPEEEPKQEQDENIPQQSEKPKPKQKPKIQQPIKQTGLFTISNNNLKTALFLILLIILLYFINKYLREENKPKKKGRWAASKKKKK